jgi:hypothetical protein
MSRARGALHDFAPPIYFYCNSVSNRFLQAVSSPSSPSCAQAGVGSEETMRRFEPKMCNLPGRLPHRFIGRYPCHQSRSNDRYWMASARWDT